MLQGRDEKEAMGSGLGKDPRVRVSLSPSRAPAHSLSSFSLCIQHDLHASELLTQTAHVLRG